MSWLTTILNTVSKPFIWWIIIAEWERGLRVRGGKKSAVLEPGIHFKIPYWDRVYVISTRLRNIYFAGAFGETKDGHCMAFSLAVQYSVFDIKRMFNKVANLEDLILTAAKNGTVDMMKRFNYNDISPRLITDLVLQEKDYTDWGLRDVELSVTSLAKMRPIRLVGDGYRNVTGGNNIESYDSK